MLTGYSRLIQEAQDSREFETVSRNRGRQLALECKHQAMEDKIMAIRSDFMYEEAEAQVVIGQDQGK